MGNSIAGALEALAAGDVKARRPLSALRARPRSAQGHRGAPRERPANFSAPRSQEAHSASAAEAPSAEEGPSRRDLRTRTEDDVVREERRECMEEPCPFLVGSPAQALRAQSRTRHARAGDAGAPIPREPTTPLEC